MTSFIYLAFQMLLGRKENDVLEESDVYTVYANTAQVEKNKRCRRSVVDWTGAHAKSTACL